VSDPSPTRYRVSVSAIVGKRQRGGADVSKSLRFLDGLRERCRAIRYLATDHLQSHNLKVPGSNPGPATSVTCTYFGLEFLPCRALSRRQHRFESGRGRH
jgi:hypothetical protein